MKSLWLTEQWCKRAAPSKEMLATYRAQAPMPADVPPPPAAPPADQARHNKHFMIICESLVIDVERCYALNPTCLQVDTFNLSGEYATDTSRQNSSTLPVHSVLPVYCGIVTCYNLVPIVCDVQSQTSASAAG